MPTNSFIGARCIDSSARGNKIDPTPIDDILEELEKQIETARQKMIRQNCISENKENWWYNIYDKVGITFQRRVA